MTRIYNPHDKLFRETFADIAVTKDFVQNYFPKEVLGIIDVESIFPLKDSFIQEDLLDSQSDLLYQVGINENKAYLYFLFEHKSFRASDIAFQLIGYMLEIWNRELKKEKTEALPLIIPLIIYHGERKWGKLKTIANWIAGYKDFSATIQKYVPDFELVFYDFSFHGSETIEGNPKLQAYLMLSKHIFIKEWESLKEVMIQIEGLLADGNHTYFDTVILYLLNPRENVPVEELKKELTVEGGKRLMTTAEQLRREGKKEGIKEGELKKSRETARKLLDLNMDKAKIKDITELSFDEIERISKSIQ